MNRCEPVRAWSAVQRSAEKDSRMRIFPGLAALLEQGQFSRARMDVVGVVAVEVASKLVMEVPDELRYV